MRGSNRESFNPDYTKAITLIDAPGKAFRLEVKHLPIRYPLDRENLAAIRTLQRSGFLRIGARETNHVRHHQDSEYGFAHQWCHNKVVHAF